MPVWFLYLALGVFGLIFGSFANVVIWRFPRGESLSSPGSHCPACDHPIRWHDNVPVLGWLVLRGRCRDCGTPIPWRYPAVELLSGVLWVVAGVLFGLSWATAAAVVLFYLLLILGFIDLDTMRLPNPIVGLLAAAGLAGAIASQVTGVHIVPFIGVTETGPLSSPVVAALVGMVLGAGPVWMIAALYERLRSRSGLGFGDVKLLAAMGLFLGPYVLLVLFVGSIVGAVVGLAVAVRSSASVSTHRIPFGPFLALGGVVVAVAGPAAWQWYMAMVGIS